jgi:hypothetical protein
MDNPSIGRVFVTFTAAKEGIWKIDDVVPVTGESLALTDRLSIAESPIFETTEHRGVWSLTGVTRHQRYSTHEKVVLMRQKQEGLGRSFATRAALIPIRKGDDWWALAQDERRKIFEDASQHTVIGMERWICRKLGCVPHECASGRWPQRWPRGRNWRWNLEIFTLKASRT